MNSRNLSPRDNSLASAVRAARPFVVAAVVAALAPVWLAPACLAQETQEASVVPSAQASLVAATSIPGASPAISRVVTGDEMLHVIVGHSFFLNTRLRLHRVYVADPTVLNSVTLSPNQIVITAMTPGISSLVLQDEVGRAQSYVVSSDLDVQGLRVAMNEAMHNNSVDVQGVGGRVILSGTVESPALDATAVKLASLYTKDVADSLTIDPVHPRQVRLKVRILEVDRSKLNQFGVNLFNPGGNTSFLASTTTSQYPSTSTLSAPTAANTIGTLITSSPLNFLLYSAKLNLGATVQDLESKNILQILAEPTITTISGVTADFLSGGEFPFPVIQPGGGSGATASVTIQFKPYGVKLSFTPIVNDDGTIRLKVAPEVSALDYTNAVSISGYTIPALSTRKADTEVELRNNQSFAISGLLDQRTTDLYSKTPGIASIPILGALFKSKNINHSTTELVVVITPTIVDPLNDGAEPAQPQIPIAPLSQKNFDKSLGRDHNPNPAPPPTNADPTPLAQQTPQQTPGPTVPAPADTAPVAESPATGSTVAQAIYLGSAPPPAQVASAPVPLGPQKFVFDNPADPQPLDPQSPAPQPAAAGPAPSVSASAAADLAQTPAQTPTQTPMQTQAQTQARAMVQVMALSHKQDADAMVDALKRQGYNVAVVQDPRNSILHLELGPFSNRADAEVMRQRLLLDGYDATIR